MPLLRPLSNLLLQHRSLPWLQQASPQNLLSPKPPAPLLPKASPPRLLLAQWSRRLLLPSQSLLLQLLPRLQPLRSLLSQWRLHLPPLRSSRLPWTCQ